MLKGAAEEELMVVVTLAQYFELCINSSLSQESQQSTVGVRRNDVATDTISALRHLL